ncbi:MAG: 50S ribosomal protein L25 [Bacteroidota bacterium]
MKSIVIEGTLRENSGKKLSKDLRKNDEVPCNINGAENYVFSAPVKSFKHLVYSPDFKTATIKLGDKEVNCVIQELQFHPVTDELVHIDFIEMVPGKSLIVEIPLRLNGTPKGAKDGGKITQRIKKLRVKTTPDKLVDRIDINIENIELGKSIRVGEMKLDGMEILNAPHIPVVSVLIPRAIKEETPNAAAPVAAAAAAPAAGAAAPAAAAAKPAAKKK